MKVEVRIDPGCGEAKVTITAPALTDEQKAHLKKPNQADDQQRNLDEQPRG